jgi:anaerobic ribonucleoside-triphosphate reductase
VAAGRVSVEWVEERRRERCSALLDRFSTLRDNGGVMGVDQVVKRDGTTVHFDRRRIENAIYAASRDVGNGEGRQWAETLSWAVVGLLRERFGRNGHVPHVEEIQDTVEEVLIKSGSPQVAKAYILYRPKRADARTAQEMLLDTEKLVDSYLQRSDWRVSENSNMNYSLQGLNFYVASSIAARYWLHKIYPLEVQQAHVEGDLHLHDLGNLSVYCCGWDLQDLLMWGFGGVPAKVVSRPPRHLRTALGQLINFFYTLQGESAGAVAISDFDTLMAPFIRYDGLDYGQIKQALQEFIYNINVPTRVGFQTPFTNTTMDLIPPSTLRDLPVIIGGEVQRETYGDFQPEMDLFNRAFAEVMLEGDAQGRVFTFPIPTYNVTPDFDWENPNLEPVWAMASRYGIPYFANFVNSDMSPEDARSMCCRLRLDNRELRRRIGGLFAAAPLTGSVGVVTINMARLGYLAHDETDFLEWLERLMETARTSLEIKRNLLEVLTAQGLYPYSHHYLHAVKQRFGSYWNNHFSTIGLIGMNEACLNLLGVSIAHPEGKAFAVRTLRFMREVLARFQVETGHLYNLEATPAEGASFRLARADKTRFPNIITAGTDEVPYYTNSTHLPVVYSDDLFEVLEHQDELQTLYTGGTVLHIFLGEQLDDWRQARRLVRTVAENFHLPYYTLTPTFSICPVHGYISGEHRYCPYDHTAEELERYGQVVRP